MTNDLYQRRPDRIRAFRLTDNGNIPLEMAHASWVTRAIAEHKLKQGPKGGWFVGSGVHLRAAYAGDWILCHARNKAVEAMSSTVFDALFESVREDA